MIKLLPLLMLCSSSALACICHTDISIKHKRQLKNYAFIAHVKITEEKEADIYPPGTVGSINELSLSIIELFKGQQIEKIVEYGVYTSCDMSIHPGDEWVLFGVIKNGILSVVLCDRNTRYTPEWEALKKLRRFYRHHTTT